MATPTNDVFFGIGDIACGLFVTAAAPVSRIQPGIGAGFNMGGSDWTFAARALEYANNTYAGFDDGYAPGTAARWASPGGDHMDKAGVLNGTTHYVSQSVSASPTTFDISGITGHLLLRNASRVLSASIDGVPATAFWTSSDTNHAILVQDISNGVNNPVFVLNPNNGHNLTLTWAGATTFPRTVTIDPVAGPVIPTYPLTGTSNTPTIFDINVTDQATMEAWFTTLNAQVARNTDGGFCNDPVYATDPDNGLKYLQFSCFDLARYGASADPRLIRWKLQFTPRNTVYLRYCIWIGTDVKNGMATAGMKFSGVGHIDESVKILAHIGEHSPADPNNPDVFGLHWYAYDNDGLQQQFEAGAILRAGQWYCIEEQVTLDSPAGASNGILRKWVNGNLVRQITTKNMRPAGDTFQLDMTNIQVYHGGTEKPLNAFHYRIARIAASDSYIGLPPELAGSSLPAWRRGLAVNQWTEIVGSSMAASPPSVDAGGGGGAGISGILNTWSGVSVDTRSSIVWTLASGGHTDYYGNQVMTLDLSVDAPRWHENWPSDEAGTFTIPNNAGYYSTGRPASCHTYYTQQFIEQRNRAMRFGATAVANSGNSFSNVDGFNASIASGNGWDAAGTYPSVPADANGAITADQTMAKNPATGDIYLFESNLSVRKWTQATNTWSNNNVGFPPIDPRGGPACWDSTRNRIFLFKGTGTHHTYDPATGTFTAQTIDFTNAPALNIASTTGLGMVYEPTLDAYLIRKGQIVGGTVYKIDAATFVATTLTTSGGDAVPMTRNISGTPDNVYNKWQYVPNLSGIVYLPSYAANAWFLRTH